MGNDPVKYATLAASPPWKKAPRCVDLGSADTYRVAINVGPRRPAEYWDSLGNGESQGKTGEMVVKPPH